MSKNLITRKIQFLFLIGAILLAPSIARASAVPASVDSLQNLLYNRQIKKFPTEKQNVSLKHILT